MIDITTTRSTNPLPQSRPETQRWIEENLLIEPTDRVVLADVYDKYCSSMIARQKIPVSKRGFAKDLRMYYQKEIMGETIRVDSTRKIIILGLRYAGLVEDV